MLALQNRQHGKIAYIVYVTSSKMHFSNIFTWHYAFYPPYLLEKVIFPFSFEKIVRWVNIVHSTIGKYIWFRKS